jgi:hypothetical protein
MRIAIKIKEFVPITWETQHAKYKYVYCHRDVIMSGSRERYVTRGKVYEIIMHCHNGFYIYNDNKHQHSFDYVGMEKYFHYVENL